MRILGKALQPALTEMMAALAPTLGEATMVFQPGWRQAELSLADALLVSRDRDRLQGYTSTGPHRADWRLELAHAPAGEALSRGQAKLAALCCLMAQAQDFARRRDGQWPVVVLDDLGSELDASHRRRVLDTLTASGAQVFLSGTEPLAELPVDACVFHVERGEVRPHD